MKLIIVLALLVGSAHPQTKHFFSTRVDGTFLCHGEPYADVPIELVHSFTIMSYPNFLDRLTNQRGDFDLSAYTHTEEYVVQPYMVIRHRCWQKKEIPHRCQRKYIWKIPIANVTSGQTPDPAKTFHIGTIDLKEIAEDHEVKVHCGVGK